MNFVPLKMSAVSKALWSTCTCTRRYSVYLHVPFLKWTEKWIFFSVI